MNKYNIYQNKNKICNQNVYQIYSIRNQGVFFCCIHIWCDSYTIVTVVTIIYSLNHLLHLNAITAKIIEDISMNILLTPEPKINNKKRYIWSINPLFTSFISIKFHLFLSVLDPPLCDTRF